MYTSRGRDRPGEWRCRVPDCYGQAYEMPDGSFEHGNLRHQCAPDPSGVAVHVVTAAVKAACDDPTKVGDIIQTYV